MNPPGHLAIESLEEVANLHLNLAAHREEASSIHNEKVGCRLAKGQVGKAG